MKKDENQNPNHPPFSIKFACLSKPLYTQSWKLAKMKIWHHFYSKKACSYTRNCKQNFFLMHGIREMNFFSFDTLLCRSVFCKKVKVNNKLLWNWVCLMFLLGFGKLLSILRFTQFLHIQLAIFGISFVKSPFLAKLVACNVFSIQFWSMNLDLHPEMIKCKKHGIFQNFRLI